MILLSFHLLIFFSLAMFSNNVQVSAKKGGEDFMKLKISNLRTENNTVTMSFFYSRFNLLT